MVWGRSHARAVEGAFSHDEVARNRRGAGAGEAKTGSHVTWESVSWVSHLPHPQGDSAGGSQAEREANASGPDTLSRRTDALSSTRKRRHTHRPLPRLSQKDGSKYEGLVKDGRCHVRGVLRYANGDRYEGEYKDNRMEGLGVYVWKNGA